jgi:hypothetical protein
MILFIGVDNMKKRVGILVDDIIVSNWAHELIKLSKFSSNYQITTIIIDDVNKDGNNIFSKTLNYIKRRGFMKFISLSLILLIRQIESIYIKNTHYKNFYKKFNLSDFGLDQINVKPELSKNGLIYRYNKEDLKKIKSANLDLIVLVRSGVIKGEILNICPLGVISMHFADNDINRGGPPGFWEVYQRQSRTGFIIQRLREELDGGDVLYKGFVSTSWMYTLNLVNVAETTSPFLNLLLNKVTSNSEEVIVHDKKPYSHQLFTLPNPLIIMHYIFRTLVHLFKKLLRKVSRKAYRWNVAYQFVDNWKDVPLWRSQKIPNPRDRFLADPFVIKKNGKHYCFVEDFSFLSKKGSISVFEITKNGSTNLGYALVEDFHLSYPFLFEQKGELYMLPETNDKKEIRAYKCINFPLEWKLHKVLMENVSAADTIVFEKNDKWWLMSNLSTSYVGDHGSELHVYYSDDPFDGDWISHSDNPVIFDPLRARNGGLICDKNNLYRVFQRHGFDMYGESIGISKILNIDTDAYEEKKLFEINANFFNNALGTHTYNFTDGLVVFDYVEISKTKTGI